MNALTKTAAVIAKAFKPSQQQQTFFSWIVDGTGSCILEAVAGAGKTTTLIHGLVLMTGRIFFGAFSKDIALEIERKVRDNPKLLERLNKELFLGTMHSIGFSIVRRAWRGVNVDDNKCRDILNDAITRTPAYAPLAPSVLKLVSLAKNAALGVGNRINDRVLWDELIDHFSIETFDETIGEEGEDSRTLIIKLAIKLLEASNAKCHEVVDYDDMVYAPLIHKLRSYTHDWVLVDEAQDTNRARRLLALKLLAPRGRLVAVGDRHQAIFGFTGADSNALELIAQDTKAIRLPLNITYRCPKAVVAYAQNWVSHIQAADTAPEGIVRDDVLENLLQIAKPGDAVLCRLSKHLVAQVYQFIAAGIPAKIEGRDIQEGLKKLAERWKVRSLTALDDKLQKYLERETAKWIAKEEESKAQAIEDKVACLRIIMKRVKDSKPDTKTPVQDIIAEIDTIFGKEGDSTKIVVLSTGHKAKGREWKRVIWLQTGPSPWARQEWEQEQEANICYVIATRAMEELILIQVK